MTIDDLPPELLRQIFDAFDGPAPSDGRLHDQPEGDMLRDPECPLKNISLVSRRWRAIALPVLFRNVVWTFEHCDQLLAKPTNGTDPFGGQVPILAFLRDNHLARHVQSFTVIVYRGVAAAMPPIMPPTIPSPTMVYRGNNDWLWKMLFALVDPLRFTIIASPQNLARLLGCDIFVGDADFFSHGERLHILSLARDSRCASTPTQPHQPHHCVASSSQSTLGTSQSKRAANALVTIRPWTRLLLNENSSICVYSSYHYFDRQSPSILGHLLHGWDEASDHVFMVPPSLTSLSYVAIFPLMSQFRQLVEHLPRIEHLYLQIVPRNNIMLDKQEMGHVQPSDLWLERNGCYELVMRKLLSMRGSPIAALANMDNSDDDDDDDDDDGQDEGGLGHVLLQHSPRRNWRYLRKFETGDSADEEAWRSAVRVVKMSRTGWQVEQKGTFVKGPVPLEGDDDGFDDDSIDWDDAAFFSY